MKHLISLSLKYIRRQKLRTVLTFMCIMLSAFILASVCTYGSCSFETLKRSTIEDEGTWEIDITGWLNETPDRSKAVKIAENHPVTDDYHYGTNFGLLCPSNQVTSFIEVSDGKTVKRVSHATSYKGEGNSELSNGSEDANSISIDENADGVFVSELIRSMGYSKGDTVTITLRPAIGVIDENSEEIKEIRAELKEKNGTEYTSSDPEFEDLPEEIKKKAQNTSMRSSLRKHGILLNEYPLTDIVYGKPVKYTFKIAGFYNPRYTAVINDEQLFIANTKDTNVDFSVVKKKNSDCDYFEGWYSDTLKLRLIDGCEYDKALQELFTALGHDYNTEFYDTDRFPLGENTTLLALEWKSPYAIYKMIPTIIVPLLIVLLITWFISRFVIDNAFEMAVHERSTHFAALRIMGASRGQIAFVVLAEALFYCVTAVPLGIVTAVLLCRFSFTALIKAGVPNFRFSADPKVIAIGAALTVIAILISAYTSAMWASRKLSPAEALNFGKPKSRKRKLRRSKSKLNLSSKKFLRRYTRKNIRCAKSRFIVATITMGLGVFMFTLTALMGSHIYKTFMDVRFGDLFDMMVLGYYSSDSDNPTAEPDSYFGDKEIFSEYTLYNYDYLNFTEDSIAAIDANGLIDSEVAKSPSFLSIYSTNEGGYKKYGLDELTGMSYEEFRDSKGVIFNNCNVTIDPLTDRQTEISPRYYRKLDTPLKITCKGKLRGGELTSDSILKSNDLNIIGVSSTPLLRNSLILPLEMTDTNYYDIELTVNGKEHYPEAEKLFNSFIGNASCDFYENVYMIGTGALELFKAVIRILFIFLASIWLVGILSMINSVNTSVLNRSRELMMLRSVGMTRRQLRKSVILETIMFSSTAAIAGTILGVVCFLLFVFFIMQNIYLMSVSSIVIVVILSLTVNIVIALLSALPAIRSLGRVESIAQAANG